MKVCWRELWEANPEIFIVSGWTECPEDKRKRLNLFSQFSYFRAGDLNLCGAIVAAPGKYKEEDFLQAGILWGGRSSNGARTVIYFVAQEFSPVFLGAIRELGGPLSAKAIYWREKLSPSLFPVQEKEFHKYALSNKQVELRPGWEYWERQLNPVAKGHIRIIREFFDSLKKRKVRLVFRRNKIVAYWGSIEIAEIKKKGNRFELTTKIKWTRNKSIVTKFLKSGWVDFSGKINEEFCWAVYGILELLESMEAGGCLETKDLLAIKVIYDQYLAGILGKQFDYPWLAKDRHDLLETSEVFYFSCINQVNVIYAVTDKPINKFANIILLFTSLKFSVLSDKGLPSCPEVKWNQKLYLLCQQDCLDELRLGHSWLKDPYNFPVILLPNDWRTEGLANLHAINLSKLSEDDIQ